MVNIDYLYNPDAAKPLFEKNYFVDKKLGYQVIEHGTILPYNSTNDEGKITWTGFGGIVDAKGKYLSESYVHVGLGGAYTPPLESIQHSSETVIYIGVPVHVWGHCLTDNIRRIWFLNSEFMTEFKDCSIVYIPFANKTIDKQPNFRRMLEIFGLNFDRLKAIEQPTQFDKIILPDESFFSKTNSSQREFTKEYRETINRIRDFALKNRKPVANKKVYYFHGRNQIGEERLAQYFKSKGYEIIQPENLTFDEQLNWLINCESFASTLGSCSHNSIFLRDGTEAIFIPRKINFFTFYQQALNEVNQINANYIDSMLSIFLCNVGFCYIVSPQLKRFFGDKWNGYAEKDFKNFLQYVKDYTSKGFNANTGHGYETIIPEFITQLKQHENLIKVYNMQEGWDKFKPPSSEDLTYQTYIAGKWGSWINANQISDPIKRKSPMERKHPIEAIKISYPHPAIKIYYQVYNDEMENWSEEATNGQQAGTTGKGKWVNGMRVRLNEIGSNKFDIFYRMYKLNGQWTPWAKNGETLYSHRQALIAIQIKLKPVNIQTDKTDSKELYEPNDKDSKTIYTQGQRQDLTLII